MAVARTITTRDLLLRLVPPRFLTERDEVRVPAIVHNYQEGGALPVNVTMTASGLDAGASTAQTVTVPTGGEARTEWAFTASAPGSATLTGTATAATASDAMALTIPVRPFGARRDVGVSGSNTAGTSSSVNVSIPETSNPHARSVVVSVMPSMAGSLLGALDDLVGLPVRLYGTDGLQLRAEPPRHADARSAEAGADRAHGHARSRLTSRARPPRPPAARERRVGMVAHRRRPPVHDRLRAVRPARGTRGGDRGAVRGAAERHDRAGAATRRNTGDGA